MSTSTSSSTLSGLVVFFATCLAAFAAAPDAGQLLRDQSKPAELGSQRLAEPANASVPAAHKPGDTVVAVREFRFAGYEGLTTEAELQVGVQNWIGRTLTAADLQDVAAQITSSLRKKGFLLARAYLPRQDVTSGTVEIAIVQARVDGSVAIHGGTGIRMSTQRLQTIADAAVPAGQPLQDQGLERALLMINDLPGVVGRVLLEQGTAPGTTRVSLDVSEGHLFAGSVWADNFGSRYTGAYRGNGLVSLNDPFRIGDQFSLLMSGSDGMLESRLTYGAPLGTSGLRANVSGSLLDYKLGKQFAESDMKGRAVTANAWLAYPLVLGRDLGVNLTLGYEAKALKDEMLGSTLRDRRVQSGSLGLGGFFRDNFGGGAYTAWSASVTSGSADLSRDYDDMTADRIGPGVDGGFTRINLSLSRQQRLSGAFSLYAAYFGQLAMDNLNSSEKFSLGGPYGVRAYPVGEASGDEGSQFNLELRRDLELGQAGSLQLVGFYDVGYIRLNHQLWPNAVNTATGDNNYSLSGAGIGLNYAWNNRCSLRMSYAWQIGENAGRAPSGTNADGRDAGGCFWITGQFRF